MSAPAPPRTASCLSLLVLLLCLSIPYPVSAHNGAVAIAVPIEGIVVDGDLSDWPDDAPRYPLSHDVWADAVVDAADLSGEFSIAYSPVDSALFIAVAVIDQSRIGSSGDVAEWILYDGCEVYFALEHGVNSGGVHEHTLWGRRYQPFGEARAQDAQYATSESGNLSVYEWRFDVGWPGGTAAPETIGLDVALCDRDEDGSLSYVSWGSGALKIMSPLRLGDAVLVSQPVGDVDTTAVLARARAASSQDALVTTRIIAQLQVLVSLPIASLAILHLLLFAFEPRRRVNLLFSVFAASVSVVSYGDLDPALTEGALLPFYELAILVAYITGVLLVYRLFAPRLPRYLPLFLAPLVVGIAPLPLEHAHGAMLIMGLLVCAEFLRVLVVAIWRRVEGAILVGTGFGAMVLPLAYDALGNMGIIDGSMPTALIWAPPVLAVILSAHLARGYARANRRLEAQLRQIRGQEEQIREQAVAHRVLERELETAHDMQMGLMPTTAPEVAGASITGRCVSANHVGGDFFQYFEADGGITISLADVTGHAMEAAIPAVMFSGILGKQMEIPSSLEERFAGLNRSLCRSLGEHTFVCLSMAEIDTGSNSMRLSNCGCPYPLHYRATTGEAEEIQVVAYALGIRADTEYPAVQVDLQKGDYVVLHSDGFSEAANAEGEQFGFEHTAEVIQQGCFEGLSPEHLVERLIEEVKAFTGDEPQADDMTCVVVKLD